MTLTVEDLLVGAGLVHDVEVPAELLPGSQGNAAEAGVLRLRPLTIGVFQLIMKAAKDDPGLTPILMIKECLLEPKMTIQQIRELPVGLVEFLVYHIRLISGLTEKKTL